MHLIIIVDDDYGMMFNNRRQSKDAVLRRDMLKLVGNGRLFMNAYSFGQFEDEYPPNGGEIAVNDPVVCIWEEFLKEAGDDDYVFVENLPITSLKDRIRKIIIYKWNRKYPSDMKFEFPDGNRKLISSVDFEGKSHEKITREIWEPVSGMGEEQAI